MLCVVHFRFLKEYLCYQIIWALASVISSNILGVEEGGLVLSGR